MMNLFGDFIAVLNADGFKDEIHQQLCHQIQDYSAGKISMRSIDVENLIKYKGNARIKSLLKSAGLKIQGDQLYDQSQLKLMKQ
ncbi:hypothetical protein AYI70_g8349 [Smittium culicis]|uniref:Uncharacterized protein n=1 Tax=Smittium culicis TaxID=133412 RepID=A0A1R1XGG2_9FUNG|nr:hypothetical protein AYI70_g8349 [Smittium culicis]